MEKVLIPSTLRSGAFSDPSMGLARLRLWLDLWSERRTLRGLDDRLLKDIGLDASTAAREASRMPWDVPPSRIVHHL